MINEDLNLLHNKYSLAKVFSYLLEKNATTKKMNIKLMEQRQCFNNSLTYAKNNNVKLCWGILCTEESGSLKLNLHGFCINYNMIIIDNTYNGNGLYTYEILNTDYKILTLNKFKEHILNRIYIINKK